jgi:hypothetical protein|tara:strand:+ start:475 stop:624 length:150 start_codon:yes stop_codon:yes gene_type:complete
MLLVVAVVLLEIHNQLKPKVVMVDLVVVEMVVELTLTVRVTLETVLMPL